MAVLRLTMDTSVFVEDQERSAVDFRTICEDLVLRGIVEVAISTRLAADKANDGDTARRARHFTRLAPYSEQPPAPFRLDVSALDEDALAGGTQSGDIIDELEALFTANITSPRRRIHSMFDADHIWAHWAKQRDYFVTSDEQALGALRGALYERFQIKVIRPVDFLSAYATSCQSSDPFHQALADNLARLHRATAMASRPRSPADTSRL
jgi:hypothetical protein